VVYSIKNIASHHLLTLSTERLRSHHLARKGVNRSVLQKYHVTAKTQPHVWVNAVDTLAVNATIMAVNTTNSSKGNSTT